MHRPISASASKSPLRCLPFCAFGAALVLAVLAAPPTRAAAQQQQPPSTVPAAPTPPATPTATPSASPTSAPLPFTLSADRLYYYSDRDMVTGENHVHVNLPDGATITGTFFAMDLKLNRFVIAGSVELAYSGGHASGAAFARLLDFDRSYFVPVTDEPDRWTFIGSDYDHPVKGREMPGDTFFLPDVAHLHIFLTAKSARVIPRNSVFFHEVMLSQLGTFVPLPTYFLSASRNPNFGQNSLAGAYIDDPFPFAGSTNAISTLHARYDNLNKAYLSYEQHLVTDTSYLVGSINPITRPQRQYNLTGSTLVGPDVQFQAFGQESAFQQWFQQPLSASAYAYLTSTAALRNSFLQVHTDSYYQSLLGQPKPGIANLLYYGDPTHPWEPDHPTDGQLTWSGFDHRVAKHIPLEFKLRSGYGFAHDPYAAVAYLNNVFYNTVWFHYVGINAYTPSYKLGKDLYFNAVADKQRQWFSAPHHIDTTQSTFSLSHLFGPKAAVYVAYQVSNIGDFYGAQQLDAYPPGASLPIRMPSGKPAPGFQFPDYVVFRGFATQHSLLQGFSFTPNPYFQTSFTMHENRDWPAPVAPSAIFNLAGRAPYEIDGDVRFRLNRSTSVDLGRSYFFDFGDLRWSPQFTVRVGP